MPVPSHRTPPTIYSPLALLPVVYTPAGCPLFISHNQAPPRSVILGRMLLAADYHPTQTTAIFLGHRALGIPRRRVWVLEHTPAFKSIACQKPIKHLSLPCAKILMTAWSLVALVIPMDNMVARIWSILGTMAPSTGWRPWKSWSMTWDTLANLSFNLSLAQPSLRNFVCIFQL